MTTDLSNKSVEELREFIREIIDYDPDTGIAKWRRSLSNAAPVGKVINTLDSWGYFKVGICRVDYKVHRIAWLHFYGEWPKGEIDHINGIKTDNRICNLRDVSRIDNELNKLSIRKDNKTGFTGVSKFRNKFQSKIRIDGKLIHIGTFDTELEASDAYKSKREELGR